MSNQITPVPLNRRVLTVLATLLTVAFTSLAWNRLDLIDSSFLTSLENHWMDAKFRLRGARPGSSDIVIVGIEDKTLAQLGSGRVFQRRHFATLIKKLAEAGPKAIGFDITFHDPDTSDPDNDHQFATAIQAADSVVLGITINVEGVPGERRSEGKLDDETLNLLVEKQISPVPHYAAGGVTQTKNVFLGKELKPNLPELTKAAASFGFVNFHPEFDGELRYQPQVIDYGGRLYPSLDIQVLRQFLDAPSVLVNHNTKGDITGIRIGDHTIPTDRTGRLLLDYSGPRGTYQTVPMIDVVEGRVAPEIFRNKIVLIGAPTISLKDVVSTPFDPVLPGVELHANIIDNALRNRYVHRDWVVQTIDIASTVMLGIVLALYLPKLNVARGFLYSSLLFLAFAVFNYWTFLRFDWALSFIYPGLSIIVTGGTIISLKYLTEERARKRIKQAFRGHLAPHVIEQMIHIPEALKLNGEKRELTVLFADIRGFTSFSEKMAPTEVVHFMNQYFSSMTAIIFGQRGTLDKLIGDALMCFWGHPVAMRDHALRGVITALEMIHELEGLRGVLVLPGGAKFEIGVGLNTGPMIIGNMGCRTRLSYTVIGDNVDLGWWLESLNKYYDTKIIISESTYQHVKHHIVCRQLDTVQIQGKQQSVTIYEPLGVRRQDGDRRRADRRNSLSRRKRLMRAIAISVYGERRRDHRRLGSTRLIVKPEQQELATMYEHGLALYRKGDFEGAAMVFDHILSVNPGDGPSRLMKTRVSKSRTDRTNEPQFDTVFKFEDR